MKLQDSSTLSMLGEKRTELMGVAMLLVLAYHYALHFGIYHSPIIVRGDIGVDMFFFLSGYGCCFSAIKHTKTEFYLNRAKRILPIYMIIECVVIVCNCCLENHVVGQGDFLRLLCMSFFIDGDLSVWYIHASLLLYLLTPWLVCAFCKFGFKTFYVIMLFVAAAIYGCVVCRAANINLMLYRFPVYTMGILVALVAMNKIHVSKFQIISGGVMYFVTMMGLQVLMKTQGVLIHNQLRYMVYPVIVSGIICCCLLLPKFRLVKLVGCCSLECYLVHQPIMEYLSGITNKTAFVACSLLAIILGVYMFHSANEMVSECLYHRLGKQKH